MKYVKKLVVVVFSIATIISLNSCKCSEKFGLNIDPDLKYLGDIALTIVSQTSTNQDVLLAIDFINEADNNCCDKGEGTNEQEFMVNIYYDPSNPQPANWKKIESGSAKKSQLGACDKDHGETSTTFLKNGYYLVEMIMDYLDATKERSEYNNNSMKKKSASANYNEFEENESFGNNRIYKVIHVTGLDDANATRTCIIKEVK